jgi:hypothetical protein
MRCVGTAAARRSKHNGGLVAPRLAYHRRVPSRVAWLVIVAAFLVLGPARARADKGAAEIAIGKAIEREFGGDLTYDPSIVVVGPYGTIGDRTPRHLVANRIADQRLNGMTLHLEPDEVPTISVDDAAGIAWFSFAAEVYSNDKRVHTVAHRISGVAVRDGTTWKLAAYMIANLVPDRDVYAAATLANPGKVTAIGDLKAAAIVVDWFSAGLAVHGPTTAPALVSGSAPAEHGAGATAARLVKAWDRLKLVVDEIEARGVGNLDVVAGQVYLPYKDKFARLAFALFLAPAKAGGWTWVAIQFSSLE